MKAVAVIKLGESARVVDLPAPEPGPGQLRVKLRAASVNPLDGKRAGGLYGEPPLPFVPGVDGAGQVDAVGAGVTRFAVGEPVLGRLGDGGHGTFAGCTVIGEDGVVAPIPDGLEYESMAALPLAGLTAMGVLGGLSLSPGDRVLVIGATGGVGIFLTQLAANAGLEVAATARPGFADRMKSFGARVTVDHTSATSICDQLMALGWGEIRALVDLAGAKETVDALTPLVTPGGKAISTAGGVDPEKLAARHITGSQYRGRPTADLLEELVAMVQHGDLVIQLERTLTLADGPWILEESRSNHMHGKTVLRIDEEADRGGERHQ
jgi:NADPH2:quinone reductase